MAIGLTFDEYFELKLMPPKRADRVFRHAAEKRRETMFPLDTAAAAGHLGSRGYACRPGTLETLVEQRVIVPEKPGHWTRADVDAAAEYFEECELFVPYAEMCRVLGCTYGDFYRALREAAEQASETFGRQVPADDQLFVMHRFPPRGGDLVDDEFVGGHRALISFTLCDDVRERLERGEGV
jgi:hypothetical protein